MPKGEYDTPGPFQLDNSGSGNDNIIVDERIKKVWRVCFNTYLDQSERVELVDLLNKGTHFDEILSFLRDDLCDLDDGLVDKRRLELIAKAEGKGDD